MKTEALTQELALVAYVTPAAARSAGSYGNDDNALVDGELYDRLLATLFVGTLAGSGTVNMRWQHNSVSVSSDAGWADVNSSAGTCITSTFGSGSNDKVAHLELRLDQPNSANSASPVQRYVRPLVTTATSTWIGAVAVFGKPKYRPAKDVDSSAVAQIVVY